MTPTLPANPLDLSIGDVLVEHPIKHGLRGEWEVQVNPDYDPQDRTVLVTVADEDGHVEVIRVPMGREVTIAGPTNKNAPTSAAVES